MRSKKKVDKVIDKYDAYRIEMIDASPGLWLVQRYENGRGATLISKMEDLHNLHMSTYAGLMSRRDKACEALAKALEGKKIPGKDGWISIPSNYELFEIFARAVSEGVESPDEAMTNLFLKML